MNNQNDQRAFWFALMAITSCMMVTVCVMIVAVFIAIQRPTIVVVPYEQAPRAIATAPAAAPEADESLDDLFPTLKIVRTATLPPIEQPTHSQWDARPAFTVMTPPQQTNWPMLDEETVASVDVRALTDGQSIDWQLSWEAQEPSHVVDSNHFSDAVAIQIPLSANASYMMGDPNEPVFIVYWRAQWQHDVDHGFMNVQDYYPHYWTDLYWFSEGEFPFTVQDSFRDPLSRLYFTAYDAGNPFSDFQRTVPVQDMIAEGFGSLTALPTTQSAGNGVWRDGRWYVVIRSPLAADSPMKTALENEDNAMFSVAVWDGAADNVGGRKHASIWTPMEVAP